MNPTIDPEIRAILVCPTCRGELRDEPAGGPVEHLACDACGVRYPVKDGVPWLIREAAAKLPAR